MGQWVGVQGRQKVAKISKTFPHCDVTSRNPHRKRKTFFFRFQLEGLLNPWMVWIAL